MKEKFSITWSWTDGLSNEDIASFVDTHFSADLLNSLKVSTITTNNFVADVWSYTHPDLRLHDKQVFEQKIAPLSLDERLHSFATIIAWINTWKEITIFNQDYVFELYAVLAGKSLQEAGIEYLEWISLVDIPKAYKIGIIPHELWHSIYDTLLKKKFFFPTWQAIIDRAEPLTMYVREYEKWSPLYYEESFADALRIYTTNPAYLQNHFKDVSRFLDIVFPDIAIWNIS